MPASLVLTLLALGGVLSFASCKSNDIAANNTTTTIGQQCNAAPAAGGSGTSNGGCSAGGVCTVNYCRTACTTDSQCMGAACLSGPGGSGCQVDKELTCSASRPCMSPLVCGDDGTCRNFCNANTPCTVPGDKCLVDGACHGAGGSSDGGGPKDATIAQDAGGSSSSGGSGSSGSGSSSGGGSMDGSPCSSSQLTFGNVGQGDSNPNFTPGVGVGTKTDLLIFTGYQGPDPSGDGGGSKVQRIYVQAFEPTTAKSKGPAQPLFDPVPTGTSPAYAVVMSSAAVAPTGQIALLFNFNGFNGGLYAAFLDSTGDAGAGSDAGVYGLQVQKIAQLQPVYADGAYDPAHVIWSNASQSFVISWVNSMGGASVAKYTAGGQAKSGGVASLPTDQPGGAVNTAQSASAGESGNLLGVEFMSHLPDPENADPSLTVLDPVGNQVGSTEHLAVGLAGHSTFETLAGTDQGFVCVYDNGAMSVSQPVGGVFVPASSAGFVADAAAFPTFGFGGERALKARSIGDSVATGGAGGVGVLLLYGNSVGFAYVHANGVDHEGPIQVFAVGNNGTGVYNRLSLTNFNGSFVASFSPDGAPYQTWIAVSGCQ